MSADSGQGEGACDSIVVSPAEAGQRLDALLANRFSRHSRAHLQRVIEADGVRVNGRAPKASHRVREGETIDIHWIAPRRDGPRAEEIPLAILFEDDWLVAVNKPPRMVVHPSKGHGSGTLAGALRHHFEQLSSVGGPTRPGIVHRLDRDTSGVIVIAKTDPAHEHLAQQFAARTVAKEYFTLVVGRPDRDRDQIDVAIGHHPHQREKMAAGGDAPQCRPARTFYEVVERFAGFAAMRCFPKTGRTHQIRVHLAHLGCPVLCDRMYGGRSQLRLTEIAPVEVRDDKLLLDRQALHAARLQLRHPATGEPLEFSAPLPADMCEALAALRQHRVVENAR